MAVPIYFRYRWALDDSSVRIHGTGLPVTIRRTPRTVGRFVRLEDESDGWAVEAAVKAEVNDVPASHLRDIADRRLPEAADRSKDSAGNVQYWLDGETDVLTIVVLPGETRDAVEFWEKDLSEQARRLMELARWVTNPARAHKPFKHGGLEFSVDKDRWHRAPRQPPDAPMDLRIDDGVPLGNIDWLVLAEMASNGDWEPAGHDLIREALSHIHSSQRSAVVLGAAAAETAVKEAIHRLAPNATYLVDETQSPPIVKLLSHYLPSLECRSRLGMNFLPPPRDIRRSLEWLIKTRNEVVHNRQQRHRFPELLPALLHCRDLIWLLDCYCGYDWAIHHVSQATREAMLANN